MSVQKATYAFEGLPFADVEAGTTILVTGPTLEGVRPLLLRMILCGGDEGALVIAADASGPETLASYETQGGDLGTAEVAIIDCTEEGREDESRNIVSVGSPSDLTGVGIRFSSLYERLVASGRTRVRTGVYTLSPFFAYCDARTVYRFVHTLNGRIRTADGLGVCAIDPGTVDEQTLSSIAQAFDARVELRSEDGSVAVRVTGLPDQPEGWQPLDLNR